MFFGAEFSNTCRYSLVKKIFLEAMEFHSDGSWLTDLYILKVLIAIFLSNIKQPIFNI
jgi:hypothetical protein